MKRVLRYALLASFCFLIWCILRERFSPQALLTGIALGMAAVVSSRFFILPRTLGP